MEVPDITVTVPPAASFAVLFPGYIKDITKALALLPSAESLSKIRAEASKSIPLQWRPEDPWSHPLQSVKKDQRLLVLRLRKRKTGSTQRDEPVLSTGAVMDIDGAEGVEGDATGASHGARQRNKAPSALYKAVDLAEISWGESTVQVQCVASVSSLYSFTLLADFQYLPIDPRPQQEWASLSKSMVTGPYGDIEGAPLLTVPPLFTKVDTPFDYRFRTYHNKQALQVQAPVKYGKRRFNFVDFMSLTVPPYTYPDNLPPALPKFNLYASNPQYKEAAAYLDKLLSERPIWSGTMLGVELCKKFQRRGLTEGVRYAMCYKWRNGPWHRLWCKRGFDPRADPSMYRYQCIFYKVPAEWKSKVDHAYQVLSSRPLNQEVVAWKGLPPLAVQPGPYNRLEAVPLTGSVELMLADVRDEKFQQMLAAAERLTEVSKSSGFLRDTSMTQLKEYVQTRLDALFVTSIHHGPTTIPQMAPAVPAAGPAMDPADGAGPSSSAQKAPPIEALASSEGLTQVLKGLLSKMQQPGGEWGPPESNADGPAGGSSGSDEEEEGDSDEE